MKVSEVPDQKTISSAVVEKYLSRISLEKLVSNDHIKMKHDISLTSLKESIDRSIEKYGLYPWQTKDGEVERYSGFSLCYNPFQQDVLSSHSSSLGSPRMHHKDFFYGKYSAFERLKNSYFDTYAFIKRTPAASEGYLGEILNSCKRTIVRSRMMIINGSLYDEALIAGFKSAQVGDGRFGWHRDEPIYTNLRINIPITDGNEFLFEMENIAPYSLEVGYAYSWNTNIPHRVYCAKEVKKQRYSLVIGVSPWFDYLEEADEWIPNEFCGKKNPLDMLRDGDVFPWLREK